MATQEYNKIKFKYDQGADVLYAFIGKQVPALCEELPEGILLRRDIKSNEIVGFTIVNYLRKKKRGELKSIPFFPSIKLPAY